MMQLCPWEGASYFLYSSNIPTLFFYSHIPAIIVALLVGIGVYFKSGKSQIGLTLLTISVLFSTWSIVDLVIWASNRPDIVLFFWSLQILIEPSIYLLGFYLTYLFVKKKDLDFKWKLLNIILYLPVVLLLSSKYNLIGITQNDCNAIEGFIAQYYTYIVELISVISIFLLVDIESKKNSNADRKKEIITFGLGVIIFLLVFFGGNLIGSFTDNWNLAQAGLIGMPIFVVFLAYLIIKFHSFNMKLFGAQVLVVSLWFLVFGILLIENTESTRIIILFTLIVVTITGYLLVKSVEKEVERKEQLQTLNLELENLVKQRESLMHLINHKVKSSFTHSKYIFAGILDGTFGDVNEEIKKRSKHGLEANDIGIKTIDLVLNTTNLQKGAVKYEMVNFDFRDLVTKVVGEKKVQMEQKNLILESHLGEGVANVFGDTLWLKEAVSNLIENSVRYTTAGKIIINLEKKDKKIIFSVKDTGVGITEEDKKNLFTEGGRGKDALKVNVDSTGYGLYSVKLIIEAHKGRVWAESEGTGKGSTFYIELDSTN